MKLTSGVCVKNHTHTVAEFDLDAVQKAWLEDSVPNQEGYGV